MLLLVMDFSLAQCIYETSTEGDREGRSIGEGGLCGELQLSAKKCCNPALHLLQQPPSLSNKMINLILHRPLYLIITHVLEQLE